MNHSISSTEQEQQTNVRHNLMTKRTATLVAMAMAMAVICALAPQSEEVIEARELIKAAVIRGK